MISTQNGDSMNLPNKLSLARIAIVPVLVFLLYLESDFARAMALILFVLAAITDLVDGYLARKNEEVTDFGKFIDPLADKVLVLSTLIMLVHLRELSGFVPVIILFRELAVDGLRLIAATSRKRKVISAGMLGKIKTNLQIFAILFYLARPMGVGMAKEILMALAVIMTIASGIEYFIKNKSVLQLRRK